MGVQPGSQAARILHTLSDGEWHSTADLRRKAGGNAVVNSRISDLRRRHGHKIEHRVVPGKPRRELASQYRLVSPLQEDMAQALLGEAIAVKKRTILDRDAVPRDEEHRYRVYRLYDGNLELVAAYPDEAALGAGILALGRAGEFLHEHPGANKVGIGILDTFAIPKDGEGKGAGMWELGTWDTEVIS